jgi:hypothetical protein
MKFDYAGFLKKANARMEKLLEQKAEIDKEIGALELAILGFAPMANQPIPWRNPHVGLTETIVAIFKSSPNRIYAPPVVRDELLRRKVPLKQKNPLATIHQILARLADRKVIRPITGPNGRTGYCLYEGIEAENGPSLPQERQSRAVVGRGKDQQNPRPVDTKEKAMRPPPSE